MYFNMPPRLAWLVFFTTVAAVHSSVDVALHKNATQSSTYFTFIANHALNGIKNEGYGLDLCTMTDSGYGFAWWRVDLGDIYRIKNIFITFRYGYTYEMMGYYVYISNFTDDPQSGHLCHHDVSDETTGLPTAVPNITQYINCTQNGRYVTIYKYGDHNQEVVLELCEVEVYGCNLNKFGDSCAQTCSCESGGCDPDSGICDIPGCKKGWKGDHCEINVANPAKHSHGLGVGVGIGILIVIIIIVVVVFVLYKRRHAENLDNNYLQLQEKGTYCNFGDDSGNEDEDGHRELNVIDYVHQRFASSSDQRNLLSVKIKTGLPDVEYQILENVKPPLQHYDTTVALLDENVDKNRSGVPLPADKYRVVLPSAPRRQTDYINAVAIPGLRYSQGMILTQLPLFDTVTDFWSMIIDRESDVVVSLGSEYEFNFLCWPTTEGMKSTILPFILCCTDLHTEGDLEIQTIDIRNVDTQERISVNLFRTRTCITVENMFEKKAVFLQLLEKTHGREIKNRLNPITVLYSDVTSSIYCVLATVLETFRHSGEVDIFTAVRHVQSRYPLCCNTLDQYKFCYTVIMEFLEETPSELF